MTPVWIVAFTGLSLLVALTVLALVGTLRRISSVLEQAEEYLRTFSPQLRGLPPGAPVPEFEAETEEGARFSAADLQGTASVVLFLSSGCPPCRMLAAELSPSAVGELSSELHIVLTHRSEADELGLAEKLSVIYQDNRELSRAFQSNATPHAFAVDASGTVVASGTPSSLSQLREIAESVIQRHDGRRRPTAKATTGT